MHFFHFLCFFFLLELEHESMTLNVCRVFPYHRTILHTPVYIVQLGDELEETPFRSRLGWSYFQLAGLLKNPKSSLVRFFH